MTQQTTQVKQAHRAHHRGELGHHLCSKSKLHASGLSVIGKPVMTKVEEYPLFAHTVNGKYVPPAPAPECPECGNRMGYWSRATQANFDRVFRL